MLEIHRFLSDLVLSVGLALWCWSAAMTAMWALDHHSWLLGLVPIAQISTCFVFGLYLQDLRCWLNRRPAIQILAVQLTKPMWQDQTIEFEVKLFRHWMLRARSYEWRQSILDEVTNEFRAKFLELWLQSERERISE